MHRKFFFRALFVLAVSISAIFILTAFERIRSGSIVSAQRGPQAQGETPGELWVLDESGNRKALCPLKHTDVKVDISGFISRVNVTQEFENPFKEKIEAVYAFPLPAGAAVDDMTMIVGERTVRGKILRREEAQAVYEAAKSAGQVASLLDQERPNISRSRLPTYCPAKKSALRSVTLRR